MIEKLFIDARAMIDFIFIGLLINNYEVLVLLLPGVAHLKNSPVQNIAHEKMRDTCWYV